VSQRARYEYGVCRSVPEKRLRQQLKAGVDMTSNVKGGQQIFLGLHDVFVLGASAEPEPAICDG